MSFFFGEAGPFCTNEQGQLYDCRPAFEHHIVNLLNNGVVVVASANNQFQNRCQDQTPARMGYGGIYDPGNQPNWNFVITVGGTNINDQRYQCASGAPGQNGSNHGECVGIYAPAYQVRSAHIATSNAYRTEQVWIDAGRQELPQYYGDQTPFPITVENVASGTSFASPIVAGVAARLLQTFPAMTVRQVWNFIRDTATPLPGNFDGDNVPANDRLVYISVYN